MDMDPQMNNTNANQKGSAGTWITTIVILLVLAFGGWYFWGRDHGLNNQNAQSNSDEAASIEADLKATDVNSPDYDLNEANFNAS